MSPSKRRISLWLGRIDRRSRLALAGVALVAGVTTLATCGGCGKRAPAGGDTTSAQASASDAAPAAKAAFAGDGGALREGSLWGSAKVGDVEDLTALATHEGATGLVEAASDPELRPTAIKAMAYAWGWAQLPFLARVAAGKSEEEARLALDSVVELAARPRRAEDPEDADELREGCEGLVALARERSRPRAHRVLALRSLRMLPCPSTDRDGGEMSLPNDIDAK